MWNSARMLNSAGYDPSMALRVELWHATKEQLLGHARVPLSRLSADVSLVPLRRPSESDTTRASLLQAPRAGQSHISLYLVEEVHPQKQVPPPPAPR